MRSILVGNACVRAPCIALLGVLVMLALRPTSVHAQAGGAENAGDPDAWPIRVDEAPRPVLAALRTTDAITIDGSLDEAVWFAADSAFRFVTTLPRDGYPPTERTVARVVYDNAFIYVGAVMYDAVPGTLFSPGLEQDFPTHDSDLFMVAFDPFLDRKNAIMFAVNPAGAVFDAQAFNDSREVNRAWEGVLQTAVRVSNDRWSVEIAVPLRTLRFPPGGGEQAWGLNFGRRIRRVNEDSYWAPLERQHRVHKMSRAGTLTGLEGLRQGRNLIDQTVAQRHEPRGRGVGEPGRRQLGPRRRVRSQVRRQLTPDPRRDDTHGLRAGRGR